MLLDAFQNVQCAIVQNRDLLKSKKSVDYQVA